MLEFSGQTVSRMEYNKIIKFFDKLLLFFLLAILVLSALMYAFVFIINWEGWFFGIKLAGLSAGMFLLAKAVTAIVLTILLVQFPRHKKVIALMAVAYFGFILFSSAVTIQKNTGGQKSFSIELAIFFLIPLLYFLVTILTSRMDKAQETGDTDTPATCVRIPERGIMPCTKNIILGIAGIIALIFIWAVLIPVGFSLIAPHAPFEHLNLPEAQDTLITKVNANGTTEWQTVVHGYSEFPLSVTPSTYNGFVFSGMFWFPQQNDAGLRVMNIDRNGTVIWDVQRGIRAYPSETNLGCIKTTLATCGEYTVIMCDGFVIRLNEQGEELWHRSYPDTIVNNALPQSDGAFLLMGHAHRGKPSEPGWRILDGWILKADRYGNIVWEKKEDSFSNCVKATMLMEGNLLVDCFRSSSDPNVAGNQIMAFDTRGNLLWKKNFVEKNVGVVYSMVQNRDETIDVYLRGEGERKYTLDQQGNTLNEEVLSPQPDSFSHETGPDTVYKTTSLAGNRTRVGVRSLQGSELVFIVDYPTNREDLSGIYSVNPTTDGGYLVFSTIKP